MSVKSYLQETLAAYIALFGISDSTEAFRLFIEAHDNVIARKNLAGHVTGSALVWHKASHTVLRVFHAKQKRWVFSAGGHIDEGELPWQAATRELHEETGIIATPVFFDLQKPMPLIMDAHPIRLSVKKNEPPHWHYDMVYLFAVDQKPHIEADPSEIAEYKWVDVGDVTVENSPVDLRTQMLRYGL